MPGALVSRPKKKKKPVPNPSREGCGTRYGDEAKIEARRLYEEGLSLAAICRERGMSRNAKVVRQWLVDQGVEIRSEKVTIYPRAKILKQLRAGYPRKKLVLEYGCSTKFLSNLANGKISP
jgi:transposase-like protein